jgi:hypothetical protein
MGPQFWQRKGKALSHTQANVEKLFCRLKFGVIDLAENFSWKQTQPLVFQHQQ